MNLFQKNTLGQHIHDILKQPDAEQLFLNDLAEAGTYYRKALTIFKLMPFCMTIKSRIIL